MPDLNNLLFTAIRASVAAGREILSVYETAFGVELKDDRSPLTEADRKAHTCIVSHLEHTGLPLLSEEGKQIPYAERSKWDLFWLVDPLDGTKEFIRRNGEFTVNIALIRNGRPVAGVIYVPVTGTLYFGSENMSSRKADNLGGLTEKTDLEKNLFALSVPLPLPSAKRPFTVVASRSHFDERTGAFLEQLKARFGALAFISKGSSLKMCLVAEGTADVYPRLAPTMEWDTAAGQAIAEFAGCTVVQAGTGNPVVYNKKDLLNPEFVVSRVPLN